MVLVDIGNDTGSNLQTFFSDELVILRFNINTYQGIIGYGNFETANGPVWRLVIWAEIKVLGQDGIEELADWVFERAVVVPRPTSLRDWRLSRMSIRNHVA